jgi:hypothetical protein
MSALAAVAPGSSSDAVRVSESAPRESMRTRPALRTRQALDSRVQGWSKVQVIRLILLNPSPSLSGRPPAPGRAFFSFFTATTRKKSPLFTVNKELISHTCAAVDVPQCMRS